MNSNNENSLKPSKLRKTITHPAMVLLVFTLVRLPFMHNEPSQDTCKLPVPGIS